jgi:hypothetical protein
LYFLCLYILFLIDPCKQQKVGFLLMILETLSGFAEAAKTTKKKMRKRGKIKKEKRKTRREKKKKE